MREIVLSDVTLCRFNGGGTLTFKEKLELSKILDRLNVPVINFGPVAQPKADSLLIKSMAAVLKNSVLSVDAGLSPDNVPVIWEALKFCDHSRLQVTAPVSTARMEYVSHKKADAVLQAAAETVTACKALTDNVEFVAEDATRADFGFLVKIIEAAVSAGASTVTLADTAGTFLPGEFGDFVRKLSEAAPVLSNVRIGIDAGCEMNLADAIAVETILAGASEIRVSALSAGTASLKNVAEILAARSETLGASSSVRMTELHRSLSAMAHLVSTSKLPGTSTPVKSQVSDLYFTVEDSIEEVMKGVLRLGYELSEDDKVRVYGAFQRIAARKERVSIQELEAIIASEAMQVPEVYVLDSYVMTTGNTIEPTANLKVRYHGELLSGISGGDGPIAAAFQALSKVTGTNYELDDFQIQSITEGREAMGQAIVRLRAEGKVYSGRGLSTDIIGASIQAYISALNKIAYEEENG